MLASCAKLVLVGRAGDRRSRHANDAGGTAFVVLGVAVIGAGLYALFTD